MQQKLGRKGKHMIRGATRGVARGVIAVAFSVAIAIMCPVAVSAAGLAAPGGASYAANTAAVQNNGGGGGETVSVTVNGIPVAFPDQQPTLMNDRTYIPVRFVAEALFADVKWDEEKETVTISRAGLRLLLTIDSRSLYIAKIGNAGAESDIPSGTVEMDVAPILLNDRTMIPIRYVAEALGGAVGWDGETNTVVIDDEVAADAAFKHNERYIRDRGIYLKYLENGGYFRLLELYEIDGTTETDEIELEAVDPDEVYINDGYDFDEDYFVVETCMVDIIEGGNYELLVSLMETEYSGPRGFPTVSALLGLENGAVRILAHATHGGGSMGGAYLSLKYDTASAAHVLVYDATFRDGMYRTCVYFDVFDVFEVKEGKLGYGIETLLDYIYIDTSDSSYPQAFYLDEAEKIRASSDLYEIGDGYLTSYEANGRYISKGEYNNLLDRFIDPVDAAFRMYGGTFENPIQ